ncbi:IS110 family transposase [Ferroplasma acidiphilum]|uniref:IS110 family transposase n=1 Tax=Ferroplasma acidiphilum TaxID=74969 RepID=UPI0023F2A9DE|nr:transposase [Ferroplasma acidiphilum]
MVKKKFDYCIVDSKLRIMKQGILINNSSGFSEFLRKIKNYRNIKIGMESTNIYHVNLYNYLIENIRSGIILNSLVTELLKSSRIDIR